MSSKGKGNSFEREICKMLGVWWTGDPERDDVFWRTSNSGGRATVRGRQKKQTQGHFGDVGAVDPIGKSFTDYFTIELKRGYSGGSLADLLDKTKDSARQGWEAWIEQAYKAHLGARSTSWMIIARRDRRETIVVVPMEVIRFFKEYRVIDKRDTVRPALKMSVSIDMNNPTKLSVKEFDIVAMPWSEWERVVDVEELRLVLGEEGHG